MELQKQEYEEAIDELENEQDVQVKSSNPKMLHSSHHLSCILFALLRAGTGSNSEAAEEEHRGSGQTLVCNHQC